MQNYTFRVPSNRNDCCMWHSENCRQPYMQFAGMPWLFRPIGAHQCSVLSYIWMCKLHAHTHTSTHAQTHMYVQCMHMLVPCHRHIPAHLCKAHCHNLRKAHLNTCPRRSGTIGSRAHLVTIPPGLYVVVSKVTCRGTYTHKHTCAYWHSGWVLTNETYTER